MRTDFGNNFYFNFSLKPFSSSKIGNFVRLANFDIKKAKYPYERNLASFHYILFKGANNLYESIY
ncbi:hypothetical protein EX87_20880 (plasmid) [Brevibacillus laterosporus]|uniref:Uncharacterized protein n=1 Tax=Brevibacillus laterosporus TaxID=1465 RepID=A0A0F7EJ94_BRELA|nr:hypothetical protein EX87_20880 [Brevibacillus laterosporus]